MPYGFLFWIWFAGVECKLPYFLETLNSDNQVSLRKKLFVGCDTSEFGSNGGLVDNAFSFDHENLDLHGELLHTQKDEFLLGTFRSLDSSSGIAVILGDPNLIDDSVFDVHDVAG